MRFSLTVKVDPNEDGFTIQCPAFPDILIHCKTVEEGMEQIPDAVVHAMDKLFMMGINPPFGEHFDLEDDEDGTPPNIIPLDKESYN